MALLEKINKFRKFEIVIEAIAIIYQINGNPSHDILIPIFVNLLANDNLFTCLLFSKQYCQNNLQYNAK